MGHYTHLHYTIVDSWATEIFYYELVQGKKNPSLKSLFVVVSPLEDLEAAAQFYFVNNGVLVLKCSPQ